MILNTLAELQLGDLKEEIIEYVGRRVGQIFNKLNVKKNKERYRL